MTSEIAVMNQRAVALAADSAVTLIDGGTVAVRNGQRKLFNLAEGIPVGLMFFGVADMMGHPWEQLVEHYQKKQRQVRFPSLRDYARAFVGMLDRLEEFFPPARQRDDYKRLVASVFRHIFRLAQYMRDSEEEAFAGADDRTVLEAAIERLWREYQFRDDGSPRADLACFPAGFGRIVARDYGAIADEVIAYGFGPFALSKQAIQWLKEIAVFCVVKDLFVEDVTGLVFAGYGTEDRYPQVVTWLSSAMVDGIVKRNEVTADVIDSEVRSKIRVFADSEVTNAFIRGIDFGLERRLYGGFGMMLHALVDQLVDALPGGDPAVREGARERFHNDVVPRYFNALREMIGEYQQQAFINPILRVLEIAGRKELAETARDLVDLNVFKKRIMAQKETVGGAIDVAVISRDDGFRWHTRQSGG